MQQETIQNIPSAGTADGKTNVFDHLNWLIPALMGIFVFFNSFPHTTAIKEITLYLALLFVLVLAVAKKTEFTLKTPLTIPFLLFLAWSVAGIIIALNRPNTIHDIYAHYIKYLVVFFIVVNFFRTKRQFRMLVWIVVLSAALFSEWWNDLFLWHGRDTPFRSFRLQGDVEQLPRICNDSGTHPDARADRIRRSVARKDLLIVGLSRTILATLLTQTRGNDRVLSYRLRSRRGGDGKISLLMGSRLMGFLVYSPGVAETALLVETEDVMNNHRVSINRLSLEIIGITRHGSRLRDANLL